MADTELTNVTDPDSVSWTVVSDPRDTDRAEPEEVAASAWLDIEFRVRRRFDESKVRRARGRFAPKPGADAGPVRKAPAPEAAPEPAPEPVPIPPPAPVSAPAAPAAPSAPELPEPDSPVVPVTQEVIDDLEVSEAFFTAPGDRVLSDGRVGTVRRIVAGPTGLAEELHVQFDDDPTRLTAVSVDDTQQIEDADEFFEILQAPYPESVAGGPDVLAPGTPGVPLAVTPGFETLSPSDAAAMQDDMLTGAPWTSAQEEALRTYSGDAYEDMNGCLRFGEECTDEVEDDNAFAARAMRPTTRATTTFRGASFAALGIDSHEALAALVGARVSDPGFTSTSVNPGSAFGSFDTDVRMQIEVPEGTPAAYMEGLTQNTGEFELLLDSGTRFEILEVVSPDDPSEPSTVRMRVVL